MASRRSARRKAVIGAVVVVLVAAAGTSAWAFTGSSGSSYRFAAVTRGSVEQTLTTTGALSPIHGADLDFQVAGTVGRVLVKKGSHVHAGERVARLDRSSLRATLTAARSTLTQARESLVSDENSQTSSASTATSSSAQRSDARTTTPTATSTAQPTPRATATATTGGSKPTSGTSARQIARDQAAVLAAQHLADTDLATAKVALKAATTACASELGTTSSGSGSTSGSTSTSEDTTACTDATTTLLADQTAVSVDQQAVSKAENTLNHDLSTASDSESSDSGSATSDLVTATTSTARQATSGLSAVTSTTRTSSTARTARTASTASTASTATGVPSGQGTTSAAATVTAAQLASDQATIDTDRASLATAKASLAQAVLTSPIGGTVVAVTISRGDSVSGSSSSTSPAIEIVGSHQSMATIGLTAAQVRQVSVGMAARVVPDGSSHAVTGRITTIGLTTDSASDDTTYPVAIALSARATSLVSGADASVSVRLATVNNAITVPTSAVHRSGTSTYVEELKNGKLAHVAVTIGAVGSSLTQITSGLTVGQRVVLANLDAAVPSSSTNLTTARSGGFGGGAGLSVTFSGGPGGFSGGSPPSGFTPGG
jgi:multidrug efflux pump subunit AcrA (membrane-fusion protein)